jgi:hypothetical protein
MFWIIKCFIIVFS